MLVVVIISIWLQYVIHSSRFMMSFCFSIRNAPGVSGDFKGNILSWNKNHRDNREKNESLTVISKILYCDSLYSLVLSIPHYLLENVTYNIQFMHTRTQRHEDIRRDAYNAPPHFVSPQLCQLYQFAPPVSHPFEL